MDNERLIISDFLLLKEVDIKIKKYNFVLGPQASGKSLLAKILNFIYQIPHIITNSIDSGDHGDAIHDAIKAKFKIIFPENYWGTEPFLILYNFNDFTIRIQRQKNLVISFNKLYEKKMDYLFDIARVNNNISKTNKLEILMEVKEKKDNENIIKLTDFISKVENETIKKYFDKSNSIFIPSSRCVYSILTDKPVTNSQTFSSDITLNDFGRLYELFKKEFDFVLSLEEFGLIFKEKTEKLIKGKFLTEKNIDYIVQSNRKINVKHVSSGQQEVLPLLVIMGIFSILNLHSKKYDTSYLFIEEPEAHLFPDSQAEIMSLISSTGYEANANFFITTHSPYLLSILNNYLYGSYLLKSNKINLEKYIEITNNARPINGSDVQAFTMINGKCKSLMTDDEIFISSRTLDAASNIINEMFDDFTKFDSEE